MVVGMVGLHYLEGVPYLEAFYFMSMLATTEGLPRPPATAAGKVFVSIMAFVSVASVVATLVSLFGPLWAEIAHVARSVEGELRDISKEVKHSDEPK